MLVKYSTYPSTNRHGITVGWLWLITAVLIKLVMASGHDAGLEHRGLTMFLEKTCISLNLKGQIMENGKRCQDLKLPPSREQAERASQLNTRDIWFGLLGLVWGFGFETGSYRVALADTHMQTRRASALQ